MDNESNTNSLVSQQNASNTFFTDYKDSGFDVSLAAVGVLFAVPAALTFLGCVCIIAVTFQKGNLFRSSCNYLLAMYAFFEMVHICSYFVFAYVVFSGLNFIPYRLCVLVQLTPLFAMNIARIVILFIGLDRLLGVLFPFWHLSLNMTKYLSLLFLLSVVWSSYFVISALVLSAEHPDKMVPCVISDCYQFELSSLYYWLRSVMILVTMACYLLIWLLVKYCFASRMSTQTVNVLKLMTLVNFVLLLGVLVNTLDRIAMSFTSGQFRQSSAAWFITRIGIFFLLLSLALNAPILYWFSTDYRKAMDQLFQPVPRFLHTIFRSNHATVFPESQIFKITQQQMNSQMRHETVARPF